MIPRTELWTNTRNPEAGFSAPTAIQPIWKSIATRLTASAAGRAAVEHRSICPAGVARARHGFVIPKKPGGRRALPAVKRNCFSSRTIPEEQVLFPSVQTQPGPTHALHTQVPPGKSRSGPVFLHNFAGENGVGGDGQPTPVFRRGGSCCLRETCQRERGEYSQSVSAITACSQL